MVRRHVPRSLLENIKIQQGIPLQPKQRKGVNTKYPFAQLKLGDSFALPRKFASALGQATAKARKQHPRMKLVMRTNGKYARVWRVK